MKKSSKKNTVTASLSSSFDKFPSKIQSTSSSLTECISNSNQVQANAIDTATDILNSIISKNPEFDIDKSTNETKQLLNTFQENMDCYPQHISYNGSNVLTVAAALQTPVKLSALSIEDQLVINGQLNLHKLQSCINRTQFTVSLDSTKDFELFFEYGKEKIKVRLFNGIIHSKPADVSTENLPVNIDVNRFQHLAGIKSNASTKVELEDPITSTIHHIPDVKSQPKAGKNAFEIRADVLKMSIDWLTRTPNSPMVSNEDGVIKLAKKFYAFVENKNY